MAKEIALCIRFVFVGAGARVRKPTIKKIKGQMAVRWRYIEVLAFKNKVSVGQMVRNVVHRSLVTEQSACRFAVTRHVRKEPNKVNGETPRLH